MLARLHRENANQQLAERAGPEEQLRLGEEAARLFRETGQPSYEAIAWLTIANAHWEDSQWGLMREPLERAIELVRIDGDRGREMELKFRLLSALFFGAAPTSEGIAHARGLLEDAPDHPLATGWATLFLGALGFGAEAIGVLRERKVI